MRKGFLHKVYLKVVAVMLTIVLFISTGMLDLFTLFLLEKEIPIETSAFQLCTFKRLQNLMNEIQTWMSESARVLFFFCFIYKFLIDCSC